MVGELPPKCTSSRVAMFPALKSIGLTDEEVRRAWAAMRYGSWRTEALLETWRTYVMGASLTKCWLLHQSGGHHGLLATDIERAGE